MVSRPQEFIPDWRAKKVTAFVTDNAANMKRAFRDWDEPWTWYGCACHNLNLVVKNALDGKELNKDSVLKKLHFQITNVKALVTMVRRKGLDQHLERSLKTEVETRWNSLLAMLRSVVDAIEQMTTLPAFKPREVAELVSECNATTLQGLVDLLAPLDEATNHLSGQAYPTLHLVVPTKEKLKRHLKVAATDDYTIKLLKARLQQSLEAKFNINGSHLMAAMLWPPHRRLANFACVSESERQQAIDDLVQLTTEVGTASDPEQSDEDDPDATGAEACDPRSVAVSFTMHLTDIAGLPLDRLQNNC